MGSASSRRRRRANGLTQRVSVSEPTTLRMIEPPPDITAFLQAASHWRESRATPLADIRTFRDRMRERSEPMEQSERFMQQPIVLQRLANEVASFAGPIESLLAQLTEQGATSSNPVEIRGLNGYQFDRMIVVQTELGVLVGTTEGLESVLASKPIGRETGAL